MACGKHTMKWKNAMAIAKREYPNASLSRRRKVAGGIIRKKKR